MKKLALLILVAVLTALVVYWFASSIGDNSSDQPQIRLEPRSEDPRAHYLKSTPSVKSSDQTSESSTPQKPTVAAVNQTKGGTLRVRVLLPNDETPDHFDLVITRQTASGADHAKTPTGQFDGTATVYENLEPGRYVVSAWGHDLVGVAKSGADIRGGEIEEIECVLEPGIRPAGYVRTALNHLPVGGAEIWIGGLIRLVSGEDGGFRSEQILPRDSLREIVVKAAGFDIMHFRNLVIPDVGDIPLFLGGQNLDLRLRVVNDTGRRLPPTMRVRLATNPAAWEIRRDETIDILGQDSPLIDFKNIYAQEYRAEVSFPGAGWPIYYHRFTTVADVPYLEQILTISNGALVRGQINGPREMWAGVTIELVDSSNAVATRLEPDVEGHFSIFGLAKGRYSVQLCTSQQRRQIQEPLDVPSEGEIQVALDYLRGTLLSQD